MSETPKSKSGTLYLVPAPLDFGCESQTALTEVLPEGTLRRAASLTHWISENAKTARAYLKRIDALFPLAAPLQAQNIVELPREAHKKGDHGNKGAAVFDPKPLLAAALAGQDMGLISEAGMPAVADPGSSIVRAAHDLGIRVVPLTGPVSLLLGLAASGLNGQNFAFVGYVPQDGSERTARIKELESLALRQGQTQQFIETPYRNAALWQALLQTLQPNTRLALASGLTLETARIESHLVREWRQRNTPPDNRTPVVFAIGR
ncbi:SAM-dependent methyltransferase [Comamonas thiooxydans]|uniref:SAM-dependent methyltransferase n=1 Tax=Comamonas thiooxydans TaxID=363952 RepID=A0AA42PXZ0_9BURK|nr:MULTISPECIES: SAM-dependent methyltransferase [Comamonas]EFI62100.1 uroporphyrin-III C/tetrapyrrole [Comamonas thiooxydans]MDH1333565.1 SAM-dependent methyltransferase [Comamonas thiooxydans]MDH1739363.1 SAM-dependent methyltransferase [Comamonas thiooxydans]MDH1785790.1 SAM-dependent methyltransferase [Comamonas thiooxydans]TFF61997.1 ribosomal RNA small subunit methyltransferase I [Comamonas sp. A23]